MITKFNSCFRKCLNVNQTPFIQVQNSSGVYISFTIHYTLESRTITTRSPVFGPGQTQKLTFPRNAIDLYFEVFNNYYYPPVLICTRDIVSLSPAYYQVVNNLGQLECIQVGC